MTDVGETWELDVFGPAVRRRVADAKQRDGVTTLTDDAFDACVYAALDVLPVPVIQIPYDPKENPSTPDLGRVGDALRRLESAGWVRSMDCVDRRMIMRSSLRGEALDRGPTVAPA